MQHSVSIKLVNNLNRLIPKPNIKEPDVVQPNKDVPQLQTKVISDYTRYYHKERFKLMESIAHKRIISTKETIFKFYWVIPAVGTLLAVPIFLTTNYREETLTVMGAVFTLFFFIQQQKLNEASFFQSSFEYFNTRYDRLNEHLAEVVHSGCISKEKHKYVIDYFNLCSEEYMLYKKGYIPTEIWESWLAGMFQYWQIKDVRILWREEKDTNSYYGFDPEKEFATALRYSCQRCQFSNADLNFIRRSS